MHLTFFLALVALTPLRLLSAAAVCQDPKSASPGAVALAEASRPTAEVIELAGQGKTLEALEKAQAALPSLCDRAKGSAPGADAFAAHAEVLTVLLERLTSGTTRYASTAKVLDSIDAASLPPLLGARVLRARAECAHHLADYVRVQTITRQLGFVEDWTLIGPFDNERGGGFGRAEEPEKGYDEALVARGKERDVQWRPLPVKGIPMGVVKLGDMLRPREQAMAYLRTTITVPEAGPAVLRISSAEAVKIWLNGKSILEANVRRSIGPDQNAVAVHFAEGSNEILAKVCTQEKAWEFSLRLTRLDGTPIAGLPCDPRGKSVRVADAPQPSERAARGALDYFSARAGLRLPEDPQAAESRPVVQGADAERAAAAHWLSILLRERGAEDDAEHSDREPARLSTELEPKSSIYAANYARSLRQVTQVAEERELNPSRRAYEKAASLDPRSFLACRELYRYYTDDLPIPDKAKAWLDKALAITPANLGARLLKMERLESLGLDYEAEREEIETAKLPGAAELAPLQARLGARAFHRGRATEAEAHFRAAVKSDRFAEAAATPLRALLLQQGRADEVLALLDERARLQPFETWPLAERARIETGRGDKDAVVKAYTRALEICPEDARMHAAFAHALVLFQDTQAAVQSLDKAVALDPKDRPTRRYLEFLRSSVKPFEDAFRVDGLEIVKRDSPASVAAADEPLEVRYSQVAYKLNPDGTTQRYEHVVATVLNEEGAKQLDTYWISHDPGDEQVRVRRARVVRKDGRVDDAPAPPGSSRVKFPPLAVGDTIDVEARIDTLRVGVFGNYFGVRHLFHGLGVAATRHSEQIYVAPSGRALKFSRRNGAPEHTVEPVKGSPDAKEPDHTLYKFTMEGLKKPMIETSMPSVLEFLPSVSVSTYGTWDEFTSWWWNLIEKECQSSPAIREKVVELVKGKTTREEKIRAIYDFVVTDVRYNAWEFGVHGYRPYSASTIFDRRYGDCKDKAILIKTMLKDVGIDAYPVLIYADEPRPKEDLTLPMVGLFNHCIAYVPEGDGMAPLFLDGTARSHPMGILPDMDHGARVVVVKDGKPLLTDIGYPEPDRNRDAVELAVELAADGSAKGTLTLRPTGSFDVRAREIFGSEQGAQKENLERMFSSTLGRLKVTDLQSSDLVNLAVPVEIKATVEIEKLAKSKGSDYALPLVARKRQLLQSADEAQRTYDLILGTPESDAMTIEYTLPQTWSIRSVPADVKNLTEYGGYAVETQQDGRKIRVRASSDTKKPRVTPSEYPAFRQFARELDEAQEKEIVLAPAP